MSHEWLPSALAYGAGFMALSLLYHIATKLDAIEKLLRNRRDQ